MASIRMMLITLFILALCVLLLSLPLYSNLLIQAILILCVFLVGLGLYRAITQPMREKDEDPD